jgi:uncharacterized protein YutE (UPF0331/DUF86 family)
MSPGKISYRIVADRLGWIEAMLADIHSLPLSSFETFTQEKRNVWAAESRLRRALEALLDAGRHIAAKGFGQGVSEYREIPEKLHECGALGHEEARLMKKMAGYRNRLVHFYHEVSRQELYEICTMKLNELSALSSSIKQWIKTHPEITDRSL